MADKTNLPDVASWFVTDDRGTMLAAAFEPQPTTSLADFNADGSTDVSDFNLWNGNKFTSSDVPSIVPEPLACSLGLWAAVWCGLAAGRRVRRVA